MQVPLPRAPGWAGARRPARSRLLMKRTGCGGLRLSPLVVEIHNDGWSLECHGYTVDGAGGLPRFDV